MLRNNAFLVFIFVIPILALKIKTNTKLLTAISSFVIVFYLVLFNLIFPQIGIPKWRSTETISIPIQQLATAVANHSDELDEYAEKINRFLSVDFIKASYNPRNNDPVKIWMNISTDDDMKDFLGLWVELGLRYPIDYLNGLITLNLPYWYPFSCCIDQYSRCTYIETTLNVDKYYMFASKSILPGVKKIYEAIASNTVNLLKLVPSANLYLTLSWPFMFMLLIAFINKSNNSKISNLLVLPAFIYWGTFLLGPISNFRYIYPVLLNFPLMALSTICGRGTKDDSEKDISK